MAKNVYEFAGKVYSYELGGAQRRFLVGLEPYSVLKEFVKADIFSAKTGTGEQRERVKAHVDYLDGEMTRGKYVPTSITIGTRESDRESLVFNKKNAALEVDAENPLPLVDGNHRFGALEKIRSRDDDSQKMIDNLLIPYILLLDGDTKEDFIALQAGRAVNRDHLLSLRVSSGLLSENTASWYKYAVDVARILHKETNSPFHNQIAFKAGNKNNLSLTAITTKANKELAYSLYGTALIGLKYERSEQWMANTILEAWNALNDNSDAVELLDSESDNILLPSPDGCKIGSMLVIALGNMLALKTLMLDKNAEVDSDQAELLAEVAHEVMVGVELNDEVGKRGAKANLLKMEVFNKFATEFFKDLETEVSSEEDEDDVPRREIRFHEGIPIIAINTLSHQTFGVSKPKAPAKVKQTRKKKTVKEVQAELDAVTEESELASPEELKQRAFQVPEPDPEWSEEDEQARLNAKRMSAGAQALLEDEEEDESAPWENDGEAEAEAEDEEAPWEKAGV